jgi:hypothetical protein
LVMGSICLLSDGSLPSVSCVTHYSFVRSVLATGRVGKHNAAWRGHGWTWLAVL